MTNNLKRCVRCILDSDIPGINFDNEGVCNFCRTHDILDEKFPLNEIGQRKLDELITKIKKTGKNKKYDCIVGVSGGTDSTFCLLLVKELGLKPLAVHLDNGWNSDIAIKNMEKSIEKLCIDFRLVKCDWDEFKDIQISFLKASVPEAEVPTDLAIHSVLHRVAAEEGVHYVINGHNFRTEGIAPLGWCYMDGMYIQSVQEKFGTLKMKSYPNLKLFDMLNFMFIKRIKFVPLLAYYDYSKEDMRKIIKSKLDWNYYGGHHFESIYTRFIITEVLMKKFGIDKRKIQLSASVRSNKIIREMALAKLEEPILENKDDKEYVLNKLGISLKDFEEIMKADHKTFIDYPTYYSLIKAFRIPIKFACNLNLLPTIFYEKYFNF